MTETERIERLNAVVAGTGATVNDAFGIWALYSSLADEHIDQLAGWADLQFLIAGSTRITDASLDTICSFRNLTDLLIGGNAITSDALAKCNLPPGIQNLGLAAIPLADDAIGAVCRCVEITALNLNNCNLSQDAQFRFATLPKLRSIEALGAASTVETSEIISQLHPNVLFRLCHGVWKAGACLRKPFPSELI